MTKAYVLLIAGILMVMASCKDDTPVTTTTTNNGGGNEKEMSTLEKFAQTWTLSETFENGVQKTSNGTGEYLYSEDGVFFFKYNDNWTVVGTYVFTGSDSTQFDLTFTGTSNPVSMDITSLNETELKTEFVTNGKTFNYNYTR
ncbi:MAG: hypothetical protein H6608_12280 [Flavobacteriales bacterium]|nr:hypothetical protein [Bacteroidota bacterium]MCB9241908.1 hypothetical protein [Flavobacteriales bacterium]